MVIKFVSNPYISILKLKGSVVDISAVAVTCAVVGTWDYRAAIVVFCSILVHSGCDVINDIYDRDIDRICKPDGAIASGAITLRRAWAYMALLFSVALVLSLYVGTLMFLSIVVGIFVGGVLYSHPWFRLKDIPGIAMADMAFCFSLESLGLWSIYAPVDGSALLVAAYIFVLIFSLTFMKDFKDVAGDKNSLPIMLGPRKAALACSGMTILPLIPLALIVIKNPFMAPSVVIYILLAIGCIRVLMGDPVRHGVKLKNRMIMAITVPNFVMLAMSGALLFL